MTKLNQIRTFKAELTTVTGLHIGAGNDTIQIGGSDNPVMRNHENLPIIPGSSIKGKLRMLLEWEQGIDQSGPCSCGECDVCKLFGCGDVRNAKSPSRIIVRDAIARKPEGPISDLYEEKAEVSMDRIKGAVGGGGPRHTERVRPGVIFDLEVKIRIFEGDDADALVAKVRKGLDLLQDDALGGSGSRGYGKVAVRILEGA